VVTAPPKRLMQRVQVCRETQWQKKQGWRLIG
jgi:hypothetical protein